MFTVGSTCDDPGLVPYAHRYPTAAMTDDSTFTLTNVKYGGRVYYKCIKDGYELFRKSTGEAVNSTLCNGVSFDPPVSDFECLGNYLILISIGILCLWVYLQLW